MNRFDIDFFEFSFLVEACIPPTPIARACFWDSVIDKYYNVLTDEEKESLFLWITKNSFFKIENEDCSIFYDRYNPDNQYEIKTTYQNKDEVHYCFKRKGRYYKSKRVSILEEYITNIKKL